MAEGYKYPDREGRQLEFKVGLNNYQGLLKTVVAFLNDIGGLIVVGIEDCSRSILGLSDADIERYMEEIPQAMGGAIEPYAPFLIRTRTIQTRTVIEIEVFPGERKPYFVRAEGVKKGVYVRIGSQSKRASSEMLEDLIRAGRGRFADHEPVSGVEISDLEKHMLREFYRGSIPDMGILRAEKLIATDPITRRDFVTLAGVLLFHPNPKIVQPAAELLFTEFHGTTMDTVIRTIDISAPLSSVLSQILAQLEPVLTTEMKRVGPKLCSSRFSIPPLALREALVNAMIHRKYTVPAPIKVALFQDRLEIFSPGNFPGPMDTSELGNGVSYYRNPALASLARRLGLVERRGLGFYNILQSCRENHNPIPDIREGSDYVKVTLYKLQLEHHESLPQELIALAPLQANKTPLTTAIVSKLLAVSAGTARTRIEQMVSMGFVTMIGKGRATRYIWN